MSKDLVPSKSARRRRRKRNNSLAENVSSYMAPGVVTSRQLVQRPTRGNFTNFEIGKITPAGEQFLKAVFAAPDFPTQGTFFGIPDQATSACVPYRHLYQNKLDVSALDPANNEAFVLVQMPVPGVAFWVGKFQVSVGFTATTQLFPVFYDDKVELFPGVGSNSDNVMAFREAGRALELICTTNSLSWSGSIKAFKLPIKVGDAEVYNDTVTSQIAKQINGLQGINGTSQSSYVGSSNMGVYMVSGRSNSTFTVCNTFDAYASMNGTGSNGRFGILNGEVTGFGDLEANVIILYDQVHNDIANGIYNTWFVRSWTVTEYYPQPGTVLAKTAREAPLYDPVAMAAYERILKEMPVAVSYFENSKFWDTVKRIAGNVLSGLSRAPGPVGGIATGAKMVFDGVGGLLQ